MLCPQSPQFGSRLLHGLVPLDEDDEDDDDEGDGEGDDPDPVPHKASAADAKGGRCCSAALSASRGVESGWTKAGRRNFCSAPTRFTP